MRPAPTPSHVTDALPKKQKPLPSASFLSNLTSLPIRSQERIFDSMAPDSERPHRKRAIANYYSASNYEGYDKMASGKKRRKIVGTGGRVVAVADESGANSDPGSEEIGADVRGEEEIEEDEEEAQTDGGEFGKTIIIGVGESDELPDALLARFRAQPVADAEAGEEGAAETIAAETAVKTLPSTGYQAPQPVISADLSVTPAAEPSPPAFRHPKRSAADPNLKPPKGFLFECSARACSETFSNGKDLANHLMTPRTDGGHSYYNPYTMFWVTSFQAVKGGVVWKGKFEFDEGERFGGWMVKEEEDEDERPAKMVWNQRTGTMFPKEDKGGIPSYWEGVISSDGEAERSDDKG